ncbi:aspartate carbamoyltransferase [Liquorilactobacillus nagelii]|jgi:aspartate carbamoyltransferase catalytic subunit|uniref:Aspartate carbamoyltransferase n=1 Tax=Liquorilactobacillus nagelii TaxID=82688 RepID=A0A3S6QUW8_9LACO|nr:aspartate carbamoyltransferase [Liquorilactobacillus nagelii]MCC7615768.1 aspartate carbamoyltransferase [Liquorilactobacillus nagelii]
MPQIKECVKMSYFVSVENLPLADLNQLLERASYFKNNGRSPKFNQPIYVANLFFENSTRTHCSFEMAERKLGLTVIPFDPAASSVKKGESLYDTLLSLNSIGVQLAVIRHPENNYYQSLIDLNANQQLDLGIINAGDGSGQHPSQSLLDMLTIKEQFGHFAGLKIAIIGDLTNSRVARSNMQLLQRLGAQIYFSGPKYWYDAAEFGQYGNYLPLDQLVDQMDVVMLLRVQHERHQSETDFDASTYHQMYGLTKERYQQMKDNAIIMHPGPINRGVELDSDLVEAPKSRFAEQMRNGVFIRMAMLEAVINGRKLGGI